MNVSVEGTFVINKKILFNEKQRDGANSPAHCQLPEKIRTKKYNFVLELILYYSNITDLSFSNAERRKYFNSVITDVYLALFGID